MHVPDCNEELSDECLMDALVRGDTAAMETLYERYSKPFFSLAHRMTACKQSSEDLVQAAFLAIWRNRAAYSQQAGSVRRWLFSIMHYRIIDYLRHQRTRSSWKEVPWHNVEYEEVPLLPDPWEQTWCVEQAAILRNVMHSLPPEQQTVIKLAYFEGLTHEKIAERCHIPLGTAKSRLRLSLLHLKRLLTEHGLVGATE
jgi:RNA polymerase sigma-70 factor (ECF subfamily)